MNQHKPELKEFAALSSAALTESFNHGYAKIDARVLQLTDVQLDRTFAKDSVAGEWSCRLLLGHLADAEIAFSHRMRRVAGEDKPALAAWDENEFIKKGLYSALSASDSVDLIRSVRQWTGAWLRTLSQAQFDRTGQHPQRGEQSLHTILAYDTWHLEHHCWFLDRKLEQIYSAT